MPIYAYRCESCGHAKDVLQKVSDPLLTVLPGLRRRDLPQAAHRGGLPAQGLGLVRDRLQGWQCAPAAPKAEPRADAAAKPSADAAASQARRLGQRGASAARRRRPPLPRRPARGQQPARGAGLRPVTAPPPDRLLESSSEEIPDRRPAGLAAHGLTIWVLHSVLGMLDGVFGWMLSASQAVLPAAATRRWRRCAGIPGLGVLVLLVGLLLTGVFAANMVGQWWLRQGSRLLIKIPIVKSIYSSVKQVSDTLFSSSGNAFREAVLVQYPRAGLLDHRLRHRQAGRRGRAAPERRLPQPVRADHAQPDLGLLPDGAARATWSRCA